MFKFNGITRKSTKMLRNIQPQGLKAAECLTLVHMCVNAHVSILIHACWHTYVCIMCPEPFRIPVISVYM